MEAKPQVQHPIEKREEETVADALTLKEQELEQLLKEQGEILALLQDGGTEQGARVELEERFRVLQERIRKTTHEYERLFDPRDFTAREEIAHAHGLQYVSRIRESGMRVGSRRPGIDNELWLIPESGALLGPYRHILDRQGRSERYELCVVEFTDDAAITDVIDGATGRMARIEGANIHPFDASTLICIVGQQIHLDTPEALLKRGRVQSKGEVARVFHSSMPSGDECFLSLEENRSRHWVLVRNKGIKGPFSTIVPSDKDSAHPHVSVKLESGEWKRIMTDGSESEVVKEFVRETTTGVEVVSQLSASKVDGDGKPLKVYRIMDAEGVVKSPEYTECPSVIAGSVFTISSDEFKRITGRVESGVSDIVYVIDIDGKALNGPWTIHEMQQRYSVLMSHKLNTKGEMFVIWRDGTLHGPITSYLPRKRARPQDIYSSLQVQMVDADGKEAIYFINDSGCHGPFDRGEGAKDRSPEMVTAYRGNDLYMILGSGEPIGPLESVTVTERKGVLLAHAFSFKGKPSDFYLAVEGHPHFGPFKVDLKIWEILGPDTYCLKCVGKEEWYVYTVEDGLIGPYDLIPDKVDSDGFNLFGNDAWDYYDFQGKRRFVPE